MVSKSFPIKLLISLVILIGISLIAYFVLVDDETKRLRGNMFSPFQVADVDYQQTLTDAGVMELPLMSETIRDLCASELFSAITPLPGEQFKTVAISDFDSKIADPCYEVNGNNSCSVKATVFLTYDNSPLPDTSTSVKMLYSDDGSNYCDVQATFAGRDNYNLSLQERQEREIIMDELVHEEILEDRAVQQRLNAGYVPSDHSWQFADFFIPSDDPSAPLPGDDYFTVTVNRITGELEVGEVIEYESLDLWMPTVN